MKVIYTPLRNIKKAIYDIKENMFLKCIICVTILLYLDCNHKSKSKCQQIKPCLNQSQGSKGDAEMSNPFQVIAAVNFCWDLTGNLWRKWSISHSDHFYMFVSVEFIQLISMWWDKTSLIIHCSLIARDVLELSVLLNLSIYVVS